MTIDEISPPLKKNNNRIVLILLVFVFLGPMLFAKTMHKRLESQSFKTTNSGDLILPPKQVSELNLKQLDTNQPFDVSALEAKWTLIYTPPKSFNEDCQENLYNIQQIQTALGKESSRLVRAVVLLEHNSTRDFVQKLNNQAPSLLKISIGEHSYLTTLATIGDKSKRDEVGEFYLIDPLGNIIMYYEGDSAPKGILKDIKRLMRVSQIG